MRDIDSERKRIDALIGSMISPFWFEDPLNADALVDVACKCLRDGDCADCPEDSIRARCEDYVAWRMRSPKGWV
jgi:hypothetical protein